MADAIFEEPRLAEIYDELDPDRSDLDAYASLAGEFEAASVLDVGCGTGTLACLLAGRGLKVIAVDPAAACLDVARSKQVHVVQVRRVPGQNLMETFKALPVRSRAMRKASPISSIGSMWLSNGDTSIAASAISRTAYRNDSRPGSPWAPYAE